LPGRPRFRSATPPRSSLQSIQFWTGNLDAARRLERTERDLVDAMS
jgi:hypothetical protein